MKIPTSILFLILIISCSPKTKTNPSLIALDKSSFILREDFKKYFDSCSVQGSIVIYDYNNRRAIYSDTVGIEIETLPASTFKIINLLIALETKTIADENEVITWVGSTDTVKYGYRPDIYRDMTVKEAFQLSAVWVFEELAKKIGRDNYKKYLSKCKYGDLKLTQTETDFWNFGEFGISPKNQVEFLLNFYQGNLPFSKRNVEIVKQVMLTEQNQDYSIRAKTGWTRENNINTGWWIGYIETKAGPYMFATSLLQDRKFNRADFGSCRKDITKKILTDLNIIH